MKSATPYLNFDGNTKEAMTFYAKCLGGKLDIQSFGDMGQAAAHPGSADRTIHAHLAAGPVVIMASDSPAEMRVIQGNNYWIMLECDSPDEQDKLFAALGEGGNSLMPLQNQFWGARFGMLRDKFGTGWMFNYALAQNS
jgi:PhnB protein